MPTTDYVSYVRVSVRTLRSVSGLACRAFSWRCRCAVWDRHCAQLRRSRPDARLLPAFRSSNRCAIKVRGPGASNLCETAGVSTTLLCFFYYGCKLNIRWRLSPRRSCSRALRAMPKQWITGDVVVDEYAENGTVKPYKPLLAAKRRSRLRMCCSLAGSLWTSTTRTTSGRVIRSELDRSNALQLVRRHAVH